ncbi:uncharacterized protein LOC143021255 [Oratosquilla oratoria]|uniref:uncharacterized protein LOC143021255 n=1 Tax=Oratosquilla oratoria TaxID=337810 RepID=UPI003F759220
MGKAPSLVFLSVSHLVGLQCTAVPLSCKPPSLFHLADILLPLKATCLPYPPRLAPRDFSAIQDKELHGARCLGPQLLNRSFPVDGTWKWFSQAATWEKLVVIALVHTSFKLVKVVAASFTDRETWSPQWLALVLEPTLNSGLLLG